MTRRSDPPRDPYTFYSRQCHPTTTSNSKKNRDSGTDRKTHRFGLPFFCQESILYMTANFDPAAQSKKVCLFTVLVSLFYYLVLYVVSLLLLFPPKFCTLLSLSLVCGSHVDLSDAQQLRLTAPTSEGHTSGVLYPRLAFVVTFLVLWR